MKKTIIIFFIIFVCISILSYWYFLYNPKILEKLSSDLFIKNISWDTPFLDSVPYKKWEELEFTVIYKWEWKNKITLDSEKLKKLINVIKIEVDDKEVSENNIVIDEWSAIKIFWEAIDNWIAKKDELSDIIIQAEKIEEKTLEEKKLEEKAETFTWTINISFDKTKFNSNINNLVELTWSWKEFIKYVNIGWVSLTPIKDNKKIFLTISKNTFTSGEYFVILQLENNNLVPLEEKINFTHSNSLVNIANITPSKVKNDKETFIVLQWNGFSKTISIQLSNNVVLKNTSFDIISDNVMSVQIPAELEKWTYYFNIMTTDWITELKNNTFTISL